jgi:D-aminoacyl-tRNA deacylase
MTVLVISSTEDPASTNIKQCLLEQADWKEIDTFNGYPVYQYTAKDNVIMVTTSKRIIYYEHIDHEVKEALGITPTQAIVISRHRGKEGKPSLTVHPIGNYGDAQFGGQPQTLVPSAPRLMTHLLRLIKNNLEDTSLAYFVCYEVTHHGPVLDIPTFFTELGSTEKEWVQSKPAGVLAQSLLQLLAKYQYETDFSEDIPVLLGIGGGHYAPRFTDVVFERKAAFGHMIPSYHIDAGHITKAILKQAIQATPNISAVYIHKKALKKSLVTAYKELFSELNLPVISSKELPILS